MKVTVNENEKSREITYPCLMKSSLTGAIMLFSEEDCGVVLHPGDNEFAIGTYLDDRDMDRFTPFHGSVTLSND